MSKLLAAILPIFAPFLLILQFFTFCPAAEPSVTIQVEGQTVHVRGLFTRAGMPQIWFQDEFGDETGLDGRRGSVRLIGPGGRVEADKKVGRGQQMSTGSAHSFEYTVDLTPMKSQFSAAHISWLGSDGGVLFLGDILPQSLTAAVQVEVKTPAGWKTFSTERAAGADAYRVTDPAKAVFYLIRDARSVRPSSSLELLISGEWLFSDAEASEMAASILAEYEKLFGKLPGPSYLVRIARLPAGAPLAAWEGDTRGRSVTLMSSDMPFKSQSLQRLHEQMRHELLHLWVPNGLNLTGNYDWFYEGFVMYLSLKAGVSLGRIGFNDMLDTLSRAYDLDRAQTDRRPLINVSRKRWNGSGTEVYARGMLAAFASDVAMVAASDGRRSIEHLVAAFMRKHGALAPVMDGNAAVIQHLRTTPELQKVAERYILGSEVMDLAGVLQIAGLRNDTEAGATRLRVIPAPSSKQRSILRRLGSENWRRR